MKRIALFLLLLPLIPQSLLLSQTMDADSLRKIKGTWTRREAYFAPNHTLSSAAVARVLETSDAWVELLKKTFAGWDGAEFRTWCRINAPLRPGWPPHFTTALYIFPYYYSPSERKVKPVEATGLNIYISTNGPTFQLVNFRDFQIEGKTLYQLEAPVRTLHGMDVYMQAGVAQVFISRNDTPYFIPVRLREYLPSLLSFVRSSRQKAVEAILKAPARSAAEDEAVKQKALSSIERNYRNRPPEQAEKAKERYLAEFVSGAQQKQNNLASTTRYWDEYIAHLEDYLKDPANDLSQPAFPITTREDARQIGKRGSQSRTHYYFLNPDYFDKSQPPHQPQLFVVSWQLNLTKNNASRLPDYGAQFERHFEFDLLKKMLDRK